MLTRRRFVGLLATLCGAPASMWAALSRRLRPSRELTSDEVADLLMATLKELPPQGRRMALGSLPPPILGPLMKRMNS